MAVALISLQGCIAIPPLIQVERRDAPAGNNEAIMRKLESIERRIDHLEHRTQNMQPGNRPDIPPGNRPDR